MRYSFQNNINAKLGETSRLSLRLNVMLVDKSSPSSSTSSLYNHVINTNPVVAPVYFPTDGETTYNHQKAMGSIDNILGKVDTLMKKNRQVFGRTSAGRTAYRLRKRGGEYEALVCIYRYDNDLQRQAVHAGNDNRRTV